MDRKAIKTIKKFTLKLKKDFQLERIIFFGSRTTKDYILNSDIDLLIVSPDFEGLDFGKRISLMYKYWDNNYDVDFLCYTPEEFQRFSKMISIAREASEKGILIA